MEYKKDGSTMDVVLTADTPARTGLLVGDKVVVTAVSGKNGDTVTCDTVGEFEGSSSATIGQGKNVKFDNAAKTWSVAAPDAGGATPGDPIHGYALTGVTGAGKFRVCIR